MKFGSHSEVGRIKRLLLKHPRDAFLSQEKIQAQWKELNYTAPPDYDRAVEEYDEFRRLLERFIPEIHNSCPARAPYRAEEIGEYF